MIPQNSSISLIDEINQDFHIEKGSDLISGSMELKLILGEKIPTSISENFMGLAFAIKNHDYDDYPECGPWTKQLMGGRVCSSSQDNPSSRLSSLTLNALIDIFHSYRRRTVILPFAGTNTTGLGLSDVEAAHAMLAAVDHYGTRFGQSGTVYIFIRGPAKEHQTNPAFQALRTMYLSQGYKQPLPSIERDQTVGINEKKDRRFQQS